MDISLPWHDGERQMHALLRVPPADNPTSPGLPAHYAGRLAACSLIVLSAADSQDRPWATVLGGERGCAGQLAPNVLGVRSKVSGEDPVLKALFAEKEMVTPDDEGERKVGGLAMDLLSRDRVKFAGKMLVGAAGGDKVRDVQMGIDVSESLGNCPKYINKRQLVPHDMEPAVESSSLPLSERAVEMIQRADMLFVASVSGSMDANHRGGLPGFVRVVRNDEGGVVLAYPEYSGNRLYQTLGNLKLNSAVGITIPDFETSDVLYLTGTASILHGSAASAVLQHTPLGLLITVHAAHHLSSALPFRSGSTPTYSPYNPPVRPLLSEKNLPYASNTKPQSALSARFVHREVLSSSIARITFELASEDGARPAWKAGEAVTLDFSPELDNGYAHMQDDDPQSLNDDYIRTFTVTSPPSPTEKAELQITIRRKGPATGLLWKYNPRVELTLPVLGFGGTAGFLMDGEADKVFVAGGVGITPLIAQASGAVSSGSALHVLWGVRGEDLGFVEDTSRLVEGLADVTTLFVTGSAEREVEERVQALVARVEKRRMNEEDLGSYKGRKFYVCAGDEMTKAVSAWLEDEDVAYESFSY